MVINLIKKIHSSIKDRPHLVKVIKNTWWLYFDKFSRLLISLLVGIFIVRQLGPMSFGEFSFAIAIVGLISPIAAMGLGSILTREFVKHPDKRGVFLGTSIGLRLISAVISVAALFVFLYFTNIEFTILLMSMIFSLSLIFDSSNVLCQLFDSDLKSKFSIITGQIVLMITTVLKIILLLFGFSVIFFIIVSLFESLLSAILLCTMFFRNYSGIKLKFDLEVGKKLVSSGLPFMLAGLGTVVYMHADQIIVGYMLPVAAVGFYAVAVKLSEFFYFIPAAISTSVFPKLVNLDKDNFSKYKERLQDFFDFLTLSSIILIIVSILLSYPVIVFLYGIEYASAVPIFAIYMLSSIFIFFGIAANNHLVIKDFGKITLIRSVLGAVMNVILSIVFVYFFGLAGAAIATFICFGFTFWGSLFLFRETKFLFFMFLESFDFPRVFSKIVKKVLSK